MPLPSLVTHVCGEGWRKHRYQIVNILSAMLDQVGSSCNSPFGVRAQIIRTAWFLLTNNRFDYTMAQRKLDCFFRPKVPRLEERVQDDGNSGEDDDEEENVSNKDQGAVPLKKVRWLSFYRALETLYLTWDSLVTYFEQEVENKQDKDGKLKG